ncbi:MAG: hypothetical protein VST68_01770, partial [Nitrospirota bacterium]|nr:hypothetical protein [Nitrospirota bacterium]
VENIALAELALVHTESRSIVFQSEGRSIANMDELTVPFGESNESGFMGRDILRANAAQVALDHALREFRKKWEQYS